MPSLMETLLQRLDDDTLQNISRNVGGDEQATRKAVSASLPILMGALARNSSNERGAASLHNALVKDHDGSILDDMQGFLGRAQEGPGDGILRHVLGRRRSTVESAVSRSSGLDGNSTKQLLATLAPIVLGALGRKQREQGLSPGSLAGYLNTERQTVEEREPRTGGVMGSLLDADGDGDVDLSDIISRGSGLLGGFLKDR